jgi:hypothetical protein
MTSREVSVGLLPTALLIDRHPEVATDVGFTRHRHFFCKPAIADLRAALEGCGHRRAGALRGLRSAQAPQGDGVSHRL